MAKRVKKTGGTPIDLTGANEPLIDGLAGPPPEGSQQARETQPVDNLSGQLETLAVKLEPNTNKLASNMKERTKERLRAVIAENPELLPVSAEPVDASTVPDVVVNSLYAILGSLEAAGIGMKYGPRAGNVFIYSPEEIDALREVTKVALAPYIAKLGNSALANLVMILGAIHIQKFNTLREIIAQEAAAAANAQRMTTQATAQHTQQSTDFQTRDVPA